MTSPAVTAALAGPALQRCLAQAGWEAVYVDLDLTGARPTAELKLTRSDGRWLWARVDRLGRGSIETFQGSRKLTLSSSTKGRRPLTPEVNDQFLGRQRFEGAGGMLRGVASYVGLNATSPVDTVALQRSWEAILDAAQQLKLPAPAPGPARP